MKTIRNSKLLSGILIGCSFGLACATAQSVAPPNPHLKRAQRPRPIPRIISTPSGPTQPGDPLLGLTASELSSFGAGLDEFENVENSEGGLGPIFNNNSCVACHNAGGTGGGSPILVTRFGRDTAGKFDSLEALGGSLLQDHAIDPAVQEVIPAEANVTADRQSTPLFGLGLIEAIPDSTILQNAKRPSIDGIRGRAAMITDIATGRERVGRFGWKNQQATLLSFAGDAYLNEMGITNRLFPHENAPNGNFALLATYDTVADPEDTTDPVTGKAGI